MWDFSEVDYDRFLSGNNIANTISGSSLNDQIVGKGGNDILKGVGGSDFLLGQGGKDTLFGGGGNDWLQGGLANDLLQGDGGHDRIEGEEGNDKLIGGGGNDWLAGGIGKDTLRGDGGHDRIEGEGGNDRLIGGGGNDRLIGGGGNDWLAGRIGKDTLRGGLGEDVFFLAPQQGRDVIVDFQNGLDLIELDEQLTFDNLQLSTLNTKDVLITINKAGALYDGQALAVLKNVNINLITKEDFIYIDNNLDTEAPVAPIINLTSFDETETLEIIAEANSLVNLYLHQDGSFVTISTIAVDSTGIFILQFEIDDFGEGNYFFIAEAIDLAGNISELSAPLQITVFDTEAPVAPIINLTSFDETDNTPNLEINAEANSLVNLYQDGSFLRQLTVDNTGILQFESNELGDGNYIFTAEAIDLAGNISELSVPLEITVNEDGLRETVEVIENGKVIINVFEHGNSQPIFSRYENQLGELLKTISYQDNGQRIETEYLSNGEQVITVFSDALLIEKQYINETGNLYELHRFTVEGKETIVRFLNNGNKEVTLLDNEVEISRKVFNVNGELLGERSLLENGSTIVNIYQLGKLVSSTEVSISDAKDVIFEYEIEGNQLKYLSKTIRIADLNGRVNLEYTYIYDSYQNEHLRSITESLGDGRKIYSLFSDDNLIERRYEDSLGRLSQKIEYSNGEKYVFTYDESGRNTFEYKYNSQNKLYQTVELTENGSKVIDDLEDEKITLRSYYNSAGELRQRILYSEDGEKYVRTWNENGRNDFRYAYNSQNQLYQLAEFKEDQSIVYNNYRFDQASGLSVLHDIEYYDSQGRRTSQVVYTDNSTYTVFTFDETGRNSSQDFYKDNKLSARLELKTTGEKVYNEFRYDSATNKYLITDHYYYNASGQLDQLVEFTTDGYKFIYLYRKGTEGDSVYEFNPSGDLYFETKYLPDGSKESTSFSKNSNGETVPTLRTYKDPSGLVTKQIEFNLSSAKLVFTPFGDRFYNQKVTEFNSNQKPTKQYHFNGNALEKTTTWQYDKGTSVTNFTNNEGLLHYAEYDLSGKLISGPKVVTQFQIVPFVNSAAEYFEEKGNVVKEEYIDPALEKANDLYQEYVDPLLDAGKEVVSGLVEEYKELYNNYIAGGFGGAIETVTTVLSEGTNILNSYGDELSKVGAVLSSINTTLGTIGTNSFDILNKNIENITGNIATSITDININVANFESIINSLDPTNFNPIKEADNLFTQINNNPIVTEFISVINDFNTGVKDFPETAWETLKEGTYSAGDAIADGADFIGEKVQIFSQYVINEALDYLQTYLSPFSLGLEIFGKAIGFNLRGEWNDKWSPTIHDILEAVESNKTDAANTLLYILEGNFKEAWVTIKNSAKIQDVIAAGKAALKGDFKIAIDKFLSASGVYDQLGTDGLPPSVTGQADKLIKSDNPEDFAKNGTILAINATGISMKTAEAAVLGTEEGYTVEDQVHAILNILSYYGIPYVSQIALVAEIGFYNAEAQKLLFKAGVYDETPLEFDPQIAEQGIKKSLTSALVIGKIQNAPDWIDAVFSLREVDINDLTSSDSINGFRKSIGATLEALDIDNGRKWIDGVFDLYEAIANNVSSKYIAAIGNILEAAADVKQDISGWAGTFWKFKDIALNGFSEDDAKNLLIEYGFDSNSAEVNEVLSLVSTNPELALKTSIKLGLSKLLGSDFSETQINGLVDIVWNIKNQQYQEALKGGFTLAGYGSQGENIVKALNNIQSGKYEDALQGLLNAVGAGQAADLIQAGIALKDIQFNLEFDENKKTVLIALLSAITNGQANYDEIEAQLPKETTQSP